jgi:transposase-like protein
MLVKLHKRARTTPATRKEIQESALSERKLAEKYGITRTTVRKWKLRDSVNDRPIMPKTLHTTLSREEEGLWLNCVKHSCFPWMISLPLLRNLSIRGSRSAIHRCLKRHGVANLKDLLPKEDGEKKGKTKSFKDYEPGFIHVDVKYLPQMPDERCRKYLFAAIDRASRWVYIEIRADKSAASASSFLDNLVRKVPFEISKVLTDNGKEFTDRFCATGSRTPTGDHAFDKVCCKYGIDHRLIKPRHPQTNGMVERFNGRIGEVIKQTRFSSADELMKTLMHYCRLYNNHIPQKNLGHLTPIQALKKWQKTHPHLFTKRVYNNSGLDM